jgi:hypothetical protein
VELIDMSGIFYNPDEHRLHRVAGAPRPGWRLVTHDLGAGVNRCRRIMNEWRIPPGDLVLVDWPDETEGRLTA